MARVCSITEQRTLKDIHIEEVSLVDKPCISGGKFITTLRKNGSLACSTPLLKVKQDRGSTTVTAAPLVPDETDCECDVVSADEIIKAEQLFMRSPRLGLMHKKILDDSQASIGESKILKADKRIGQRTLKAGSWLLLIDVRDRNLRKLIANDEIAGVSVGGRSVAAPVGKCSDSCSCNPCKQQRDEALILSALRKLDRTIYKGTMGDNRFAKAALSIAEESDVFIDVVPSFEPVTEDGITFTPAGWAIPSTRTVKVKKVVCETTLMQFAHEVGHLVADHAARRLSKVEAESEAYRFAIDAMKTQNIEPSCKLLDKIKADLRFWAIAKLYA